MMLLKDVMSSKKLLGTYSSGALPRSYVGLWEKNRDEDDHPFIEPNDPYVIPDFTAGTIIGAPPCLTWHLKGDSTENITISLPFLREYTKCWQIGKLLDIYKDIEKQFHIIRKRTDNWDGYGSKQPSRLSISNAENIIKEILNSVIEYGYIWLTPFISSDEDGYITIEWHKGQYELHIIVRDNEAEYIKAWGVNIEHEMHLDFLSQDDYQTLWKWLLNG